MYSHSLDSNQFWGCSIPLTPRQPFRRGGMLQLHITYHLSSTLLLFPQLNGVCNILLYQATYFITHNPLGCQPMLNEAIKARIQRTRDRNSPSANPSSLSQNWDHPKRFLRSQGRHTRSCSSWKTPSRRSWMGGRLQTPSTGPPYSNACTSPRCVWRSI